MNQATNFPLTLQMQPIINLNEEQFFAFCQLNRDLRIERNAQGDIHIMAPTGGESSRRNFKLITHFGQWAEKDNRGIAFDSSGGFILPNGAIRSPDLAWVRRERLQSLTATQKQRFLPLAPDFVVEIRSPSDNLATLQEKMLEYITNGVLLGWLLDPTNQTTYIYQPATSVQTVTGNQELSASNLLPNYTLPLTTIWDIDF
ncbi:MAG TPA: Uma2 family endonuclease [Anaerolineae bacterium]|nr:Uma2 family endonuclease [Anaerolineae bacterium]